MNEGLLFGSERAFERVDVVARISHLPIFDTLIIQHR